MRKSTNLVLAAGLAASAFATTAAASQQRAGCDNPDEREIVTEKGFEAQVEAGPVPMGAPVFYVYTYLLDVKKKAEDVTITISWDNTSDYDLDVWFDNGGELSESQASRGDQLVAGEEAVETATLEAVPDCAFLKVGIENYLGDPTHLIDLAIEVG